MTPSATDGYLRFPTIRGDRVAFVAEDDVWTAPASGGTARRLTEGLGEASHPVLSPDGAWVAVTGRAEADAPEVYALPTDGGPASRLTWLGDAYTRTRGFTPDGRVLFVSAAAMPFRSLTWAYAVPPTGGPAERLPYGPVGGVAFGPGGSVLLGTNSPDPARWKRYRGGTAGRMWLDPDGSGGFHRLLDDLDSNIACPMWVGERVFFLSDHEGPANLYSCSPDGSALRRHTDHDAYYARWAASDGTRIVYQHAAEIWLLDPASDRPAAPIPVTSGGPRFHRRRRFVPTDTHLGEVALHPAGHSLLAGVRGKPVTLGCFEGPAAQHGQPDGVRYRHARYLGDGATTCAVSDADGEDGIDVIDLEPGGGVRRLAAGLLGRVVELAAAPDGSRVAVANHRGELLTVDLGDAAGGAVHRVDRADEGPVSGLAFAPDGRWLAYSFPLVVASNQRRQIRLAELPAGAVHEVTDGEFRDEHPSFDPGGRYLYFLSRRVFDPVADSLLFDHGFPKGCKPYLVTLRADAPSPFLPSPRPPGPASREGQSAEPSPVAIDLDGIDRRVVPFPVPEDRYTQVLAAPGRALLVVEPVEGQLGRSVFDETPAGGRLEVYDLVERSHRVLVTEAGPTTVSRGGSTLAYRHGARLRVLPVSSEPPKEAGDEPGHDTGWVDLTRVRVAVDPAAEWRQMLAEAWRWQRDHFWVEDMSGVDWPAMFDRYRPLVDRVATRADFSDLMWEMQGELGTSHAYEVGGDHPPTPGWSLGHLAADLAPDGEGRWRLAHVVDGDRWDPSATSPLTAPGVDARPGDTLLAVDGQPVDAAVGPGPLLTYKAGQPVELTLGGPAGDEPRRVTVTLLGDERPARYREWVKAARERVHAATGGRVGYLHVPDMQAGGFAEFHRGFLAELERDALVVDVRENGGGNVSPLLLEKLARRRIAYVARRWHRPEPYPRQSPAGPLVCVTNESAGSDGDIFTHGFTMFGLGPVVGTRTWGGVVGIEAFRRLADGTVATQPEHSFWFSDVGWGIENHGATPDVEVDIPPQDHAAGRDPQLDTAIDLVLAALDKHRPALPDLRTRPDLARPRLPLP